MGRKVIGKKTRFEVFKRDSFKCVYCGCSAPEVVLQIDHITPVAKGGTDDLFNLASSCFDCNSGKSDRRLDDRTAIQKQKAQLDQLQERQEQLQMLVAWQKGLTTIREDAVSQLADILRERMIMPESIQLSESGRKLLRRWFKEFGFEEMCESIDIATDYYLKFNEEGDCTSESFEYGFKRIGGIAKRRRIEKENPELARIHHCYNILKKNVRAYAVTDGLKILKEAFDAGVSTDDLMIAVRRASGWYKFIDEINDLKEKAK